MKRNIFGNNWCVLPSGVFAIVVARKTVPVIGWRQLE
jgi:hypothetical protein